MMTNPLESRLTRIRIRIRQVLWLYGVSWILAVVLGATLVAGFFDWLLHFNDSGVRLVLGLSILMAGGWVGWRYLVVPLTRPLSEIDLALKIERRFPGFNDSLASTVQFLRDKIDPLVGSPSLQQRVIAETLEHVNRLDVTDVVETHHVRGPVAVAIVVCLASAGIVAANRAEASLALTRLVFPFADVAWPKTTELRLMNADFEPLQFNPDHPLRVARGQTLKLYVENVKGDLPDDLRMEYRYSDDEIVFEELRKITRRDGQDRPRDVGVATLLAGRGPVWFRAVGGDDWDNPLFKLHVVPAPALQWLQVTLSHPDYAGREQRKLAPGVGHVQDLIGSVVDVQATVNKPLRSSLLRIKDRQPQSVEISDDGMRLKTTFRIEQSGVSSYWFELVDREGFENPEAPRYEIRGTADLPPEVRIEEPRTDLLVTSNAEIPLQSIVQDDLGLKDVRLHYKFRDTQDNPGDFHLLHDALAHQQRPLELTVEYRWLLQELQLDPGMRIVFHVEATDFYDLGSEHVGRSMSRMLTIVSADEKADELATRQADFLEELDRVYQVQSRAHQQVGELQTQLRKVGTLRPDDVDLLKRIELDQRQISSRLLNPVDGIERRALQLRAELKDNKINDPEMKRRLDQIADELSMLSETPLPAIEQELTRARKATQISGGADVDDGFPVDKNFRRSAEPEKDRAADGDVFPTKPSFEHPKSDGDNREQEPPASSGPDEQATMLDRAGEHQRVVLESLDEMRRQLSQWRNRHDLLNELSDLRAGQQQVNEQTMETFQQTLGRSLFNLTRQQQADLRKLANRQRNQAERIGRFREKLEELRKEAAQTSPSVAARLGDAQDHIRRRATAEQMRRTAEQLENNDVGQASSSQQQIADDLQELNEILSNRGVDDAETLVKKLQQAENELAELRKRQTELLRKVQQAEQLEDSRQRELQLQQLKKEQKRLSDDVASMARRLRRLQAQSAGESAGRAAERMRNADEDLARQASEAAMDEQHEALDDLEQAQRELAQQRQETEERLARELLERIADQLKDMIALEQNVIDETRRLEVERQKQGNWSRGQLQSLLRLAETQRNLKRDTDHLVETLKAAEIFALALRGASRQMQRAAERLAENKTDAATISAEVAAKQRFLELILALKPESGSNAQPDSVGAGTDLGGPPVDGIPQLAQLKMLKTIQENLLKQTTQLDERKQKNDRLTDEEQRALQRLADEQGELADLARNLTRALTKAIEGDRDDGRPQEDR